MFDDVLCVVLFCCLTCCCFSFVLSATVDGPEIRNSQPPGGDLLVVLKPF